MKNNHIFPFLWMRGEEESVLRTEMQKIAECGIGAVCVEARPHNEFCKEGWWHDMDIILDEAKKRDMKVWILDDRHFPTGYANGLIEEKYPERKKLYIASSKANVCGYPNRPLTLNIRRMLKPAIGFWEIPDAMKNMEERAKNKLLAVIAVKAAEEKRLHEEVIDLTGTVKGDFAYFTLPEGLWTVYVIFKTRTDGGNEAYINLIDAQSAYTQIEGVYEAHYAHYPEEFGKTIAGFFSDETQFGNVADVCYDAALGRKKMPLPWSDELEKMLKERYGASYISYLPFLFQDSEEKTLQDRIRYDYMDCVSRLYKKNFSDTVGRWCEEHGVEYIGHVVEDNGTHSRFGMGAAHFFRAMSGQHMAGIDCIGEQVVFGAPVYARQGLGEKGGDGEFYHYTLGKLGASCGHLDPRKKGRTMCELFGAYGWNFGVRDMKYVLDHLLVKGVNELVPHAFSMAEYPDEDCPPHFYARGNNPEFPYFARLMKYANRMCELLSHGQHVATAAVLYDGEADWIGGAMPMQKVNRGLLEHQIDFDIVSMDMLENLEDYNGSLHGDKLSINGVTFDVLVIPYTRAVPAHFAAWLAKKGDFPVIFADGYPEVIAEGTPEPASVQVSCEEAAAAGTPESASAQTCCEDTAAKKAPEAASAQACCEDTMAAQQLRACCETVPLGEIAAALEARGFYDIRIDHPFKDLSFYHYRKDGEEILVLQNESAFETFRGTVSAPFTAEMVYYDALADRYESAAQEISGGCSRFTVELAPAECLVLTEKKDQVCTGAHRSFSEQLSGLAGTDLSAGWDVAMVRAIDYPNFGAEERMETLKPVSVDHPDFCGVIRYRKTITLDRVPEKAYLKADQVYEVMKVLVNGEEAGFRLNPPYQVELTGCLRAGENEICIEVATTPARDQLTLPQPPFDFSYEALEATGMFGKVVLFS